MKEYADYKHRPLDWFTSYTLISWLRSLTTTNPLTNQMVKIIIKVKSVINSKRWLSMVDDRQLGADHVTFQGIKKAGHLVHLERPCAYNRCLKEFLASLHADGQFTPSWKENRKSSPAFLINIYYHIICIMYHCFKLSSEINNSFFFFFFFPLFWIYMNNSFYPQNWR